MKKLSFKNSSPASLDRLSKAQSAIDAFCKKHPKDLTPKQHKQLRGLLSERADALSDALGVKISPVVAPGRRRRRT